MQTRRWFGKIKSIWIRVGFRGVVRSARRAAFFYFIGLPKSVFLHYFYKTFRKPRLRYFDFQGRTYEYVYRAYNFTWSRSCPN